MNKMLIEEFENHGQKIELTIPEGWSLHVNGRKDHVFLVDPSGEKVIFLLDNIPYLCVTNIIVYITYQLANFMKINDVTIDNIRVEHHSNIEIDFSVKSDSRKYTGKMKLYEKNQKLKLLGILSAGDKRPDLDLAVEVLSI